MGECTNFVYPSISNKILKEVDNLSYKNIQYGRTRIRRNYARVQTNVELPNLIAQLPSSYLSKEGRLYPKDDNDSFKKIYTTDGVLAIIYNVNDGDYTEKLNSKDGYLPLVELGSYTLKIKSPKGEISSVKYTDLFPTSSDFNPLQASNLAQSVISLAKSIVFFVVFYVKNC